GRDFLAGQLLRAMLFLLQRLAFGHESLVLSTGLVIRDKFFDALAGGTEFRLVQNRLAEFPGLVGNHAFLSRLHNHFAAVSAPIQHTMRAIANECWLSK